MLVRIRNCQCTAGKKHKHNRLAAFNKNAKHLLLKSRKLEIRFVTRGKFVTLVALFSFKARIQTHDGNHNIAHRSNRLHLGDAVIGLSESLHAVFEQMAALGIDDSGAVSDVVANSFEHGNVLRTGALVVAYKSLSVVCIGSDYADGPDLLKIKRQKSVLVLQ